MAEILTPQGLNEAETLQDDNLMEVYQSPSGGVRDNKKARLDTLRDYYKKLPAPFTPNNLVQADGTGTLKTTLLSTTEVSNTVTRSQNNESAIGVLDQRVDDNDADITNLQNKTPQSYKVSDTPEFADVNITGLTGTVENRIETNTSDIGANDSDITNLQNKTPQSYKATDTITLADLILTGLGNIKGIIQGILDKLDQGVKTTDDVTFGRVTASRGINADGRSLQDSAITGADIYAAISPSLPNIGDIIAVTGSIVFGNDNSSDPLIIAYAERETATTIQFKGSVINFISGAYSGLSIGGRIANSTDVNVYICSISW